MQQDDSLFIDEPFCQACLVGVSGVWDYTVAIRLGGKEVRSNQRALCFDCYRVKLLDDLKKIRNWAAPKQKLAKFKRNNPIPDNEIVIEVIKPSSYAK